MTYEEAKFILRHGSAEGIHNYLKAIKVIENEITRQKAEIGHLEAENKLLINRNCELVEKGEKAIITFVKSQNHLKSEARREFAERVKPLLFNYYDSDIDNLLKEMESESDAE